MVRRAGIVLGVVLTVVLAALSIIVIGIRTQYPPAPGPSPALRARRR